MRNKKVKIIKAAGNPEVFSKEKLFKSLVRAGLSKRSAGGIADKVAQEVAEGTNTRYIYKKALQLVNKSSPIAAINYSLKRAIFDLGPTGHHFESYVAKYFIERGYQTETCKMVQGKFVIHEIDVVAEKSGKKTFIECKFHNRAGIKNDIKIALYVKARRDDLLEGPEGKHLTSFFLASNTSFTSDAIKYSQGSNLHLLGVNAPPEKSFFDEVKAMKLYPITSLKSLNHSQKADLLNRNIILAKELPDQTSFLRKLRMNEDQIQKILDEVELLMRNDV
jgi:hypothetical protein